MVVYSISRMVAGMQLALLVMLLDVVNKLFRQFLLKQLRISNGFVRLSIVREATEWEEDNRNWFLPADKTH